MLKAIKAKIQKRFCRHYEWEYMKKVEKFQCLSGERIYVVCSICGKELGSYFERH